MAEGSKIEWTDNTFNPWIGCTRVSEACDNCYAATSTPVRTMGIRWEPGAPRHRTRVQNWNAVKKWDRKAESEGVRTKVFCASLADVFDTEVPVQWRVDLFKLIQDTPHLDWQLLTKRPAVAQSWFSRDLGAACPDLSVWWDNIWLGTTVENRSVAKSRIRILQQTPFVKKRWLSMEPLFEYVDLRLLILRDRKKRCGGIDWVVVGGESAPAAKIRHMDPQWARDIRDDCQQMLIPFFMKQMSGTTESARKAIPDDLLIREFPI